MITLDPQSYDILLQYAVQEQQVSLHEEGLQRVRTHVEAQLTKSETTDETTTVDVMDFSSFSQDMN